MWMKKTEKTTLLIACLLLCLCLTGCRKKTVVREDGYRYLIGVSLTNVMEPWLNNLAKITQEEAAEDTEINLIIRDAAGSSEKQAEDIEALLASGIDLLIMASDGSERLDEIIDEVAEQIPIVVVGIAPGTDNYTTLIRADDEGIGHMAGEFIAENIYREDQKIVVIEGVADSPISQQRREGFMQAIENQIPPEQITFCGGEWLRDVAEARMKDYLVVHENADIVFAFNDEMAYGAYLSCQQLRVETPTVLVGVDGFDGESEGLHLVETGILDATIQSPDFAALAYEQAQRILHGETVEKNITIYPRLIRQ